MAKRSQSLIPLTHDHHHALAHARRLIEATDKQPDAWERAAAEFITFYETQALVHFREEEEELFPKLLDSVEEPPPELIRVLVDHVRIHGMVSRMRQALELGQLTGDQLKNVGETLRAHVRFEEDRLFPLIEKVVPKAALDEVSFAERKRGQG